MKHTRTIGAAGLGLLGWISASTALQSQHPGSAEIGVFGVTSFLDATLFFKDDLTPFGLGGRAGVYLFENLAFEADVAFSDGESSLNDADINFMPAHARLIYNLFVGENTALLFGAGGGRSFYNVPGGWFGDWSAGGLIGVRHYVAESISLRADAFLDYMPGPTNQIANNNNWGVQFGVSKTFGPSRDPDTDADGIVDRLDQCPATPPGEPVDMSGCQIDTDGDGVYDNRDACGGTPSDERVDATGCPLDTDNDGVTEVNDRCSGTAAGEAVDANGCPLDTDGDGVRDSRDNCSNTPANASVDSSGCPLDTDNDGVADFADRCAGTPAGATVDNDGCPSDSDSDGVLNGLDRCVGTAAGTAVDASGCPVLFADEETASVVLEGVTFASGSSELTANAMSILDLVAQSLVGNTDVRVEIAGYTDNTGSRNGNVNLSQVRAESVMAYLASQGVAAERMVARGYGPESPVADNGTREGRAQNRRVELHRL